MCLPQLPHSYRCCTTHQYCVMRELCRARALMLTPRRAPAYTRMPQLAFSEAYAFNGNISTWDTSNVRSMNKIFYASYAFDQDISAWDVSRVTDFNSQTFTSANAMRANAAKCTRHNIQVSWSSQSSFNENGWYNSACAR